MSKIEWTDMTWNPVTGCTKVSPGCDHCYAEAMSRRLQRLPKYAGTIKDKGWSGKVFCHADQLDIPYTLRKPRMIFVCSMSDLFHSDVPFSFIWNVFYVMASTPQHTYQVLTKRPGRMKYFAETLLFAGRWPQNVWAGTSVESKKYLPRLDLLIQVPAPVRFASFEPLLEDLDVGPYLRWADLDAIPVQLRGDMRRNALSNGVNWAICGGESGPGARPMPPDWARSIRDQCNHAGVPFFFKQWNPTAKLGKLPAVLDGIEWKEMPYAVGQV